MRFGTDVQLLLVDAANSARGLGHSCVGSVHLLLAISRDTGLSGQMLRGAGVDSEVTRQMVAFLWGTGTSGLPLPQGLSVQARQVLKRAAGEAKDCGSSLINNVHVLLSLLRQEKIRELLTLSGVEEQVLFDKAVHRAIHQKSAVKSKEAVRTKLLEQFSEDMIQKAGSMDPVIGREKEIDQVIEILSRKHKNNPALVGEPGVGKTAIAEGLAQRMAAGAVPPQLRDKRLISLNMANLVAGTKYRGEFEERIRDVLAEIRRSGDIILFVDEMHTIVGAGAAEGAIDAANIFKPALGRGEVQMLGATTPEEYRRFIEKDGALERRFRPVKVAEPDEKATMDILRGIKPGLEKHHRMRIREEALLAALEMSRRYLPDLYLPDKAIDLLDEGAAHARLEELHCSKWEQQQDLERELHAAVRDNRFEKAAILRDKMQKMSGKKQDKHGRSVTAQDVAWAVSARTGIPVGRLTSDERQRLKSLEQILSRSVIGQQEAVSQVAQTVRRGLFGLRDGERPVASLLLTGPTGVGKTEMCRALAKELYGSKDAMIRLDMTEYMEKHAVARLIGAPPGYVGYEDGGKLTEAVRRRPYCLVLFDEIEKAHPDIAGILLQIMEEGVLTDSTGRRVSFRNAVVVMTSNIGGEQKSDGLGFQPSGREDRYLQALRQRFTPEFLGRIDKVVCFRRLEMQAMTGIAQKYLGELQSRAAADGMDLQLPKELAGCLGALARREDGARQMRRLVQEKVEGPLAVFLLDCEEAPKTVKGMWQEQGMKFHC